MSALILRLREHHLRAVRKTDTKGILQKSIRVIHILEYLIKVNHIQMSLQDVFHNQEVKKDLKGLINKRILIQVNIYDESLKICNKESLIRIFKIQIYKKNYIL